MAPEASPESYYCHEDEKGYQETFPKDVSSLVQGLEEFGCPFEVKSRDLSVLDTKVKDALSRMKQMEQLGKKHCKELF